MSQITVLGFTPSRSHGSNTIHWSILLSPTPTPEAQSTRPSMTKHKSSFFSATRRASKANTNGTLPDTVLFDMHNHQVRQQAFPVPAKVATDEDTGFSNASPVSPSSPAADAEFANLAKQTTTSISSDIRNQPMQLLVRIVLARHHLSVSKLSPKVATLLYRTPTYGPDDDWLRAALDMLVGAGVLEPASSFEADAVLAFAGDAVKEYLSQPETSGSGDDQSHKTGVLDLDYAAHIASMEEVKAMFAHHNLGASAPPSPPYSPSGTPAPATGAWTRSPSTVEPRRKSGSKASKSSGGAGVLAASYKFLGLRISQSPMARRHAAGMNNNATRGTYSWERQDDPYAGLM